MEDGEPYQHTLPPADARPPLSRVDVAPGDDVDAVDAVLRRLLHRPFDLTADIPVRAALIRRAPEEHVLLVVAHHIACDAVSMGPLAGDLAAAYDARRTGRPPAWPALELRYADHTLWQRELLGRDGGGGNGATGLAGRQAAYWARTLEGMPSVTPLPWDRPRPPERDGAGERIDLAVGPELHARLAGLARSQRATVFMVVHAALVAVLRDRGAGDDVAVGTVVAGRGDGMLDDLVGFFVNTLVLRVDAGGDPAPVELLRRARDVDVAALANQDVPFERVVEVVNPPRSMAHHPLVQVMLAFQADAVEPPALGGLDVAFAPFDPGVAKFDLSFVITETFTADRSPAGLTGYVELATDIVDRSSAERIRDELLARLAAFGAVEPCESPTPTPTPAPAPERVSVPARR
jgi:pristinamycin I synthase-3/4